MNYKRYFISVIVLALLGCDSPEQNIEEKRCVVAMPSGNSWTDEDVEKLTEYIHPPIGGIEERRALFFDVLTAHSLVEGELATYEPKESLGHYRQLLADYHFNRTFEEGTTLALEAFSEHRDELELSADKC